MKCSVNLQEHSISLKYEIATTDFMMNLADYYSGLSTDKPDISLFVKELNEDILPLFIPEYNVLEHKAILEDIANAELLIGLFSTIRSRVTASRIPSVAALAFPADIVVNLLEALPAQQAPGEVGGIGTGSSLEPPLTVETYKDFILEERYKDRNAYSAARFKGSDTTEIAMYKRFTSETIVKNIFLNTDTKNLVSQLQIPGEISEIDQNLKANRKAIVGKLLDRLNVLDSKDVRITSANMDVFLKTRKLNTLLKRIEPHIMIVKYEGEMHRLIDEDVLTDIASKSEASDDPKEIEVYKTVVDNYIDYIIAADYDRLFRYYAGDVVDVEGWVDAFDPNIRKYSIHKKGEGDRVNESYDEKIKNGVDLQSNIYKTIIETTPMLSYITGEQQNDSLYPAAVSHVFANYFHRFDPQRPIESIKEVIITELNDPSNSFTNKDVLYTIYKKFFEEEGDNFLPHHKNINFNPATRQPISSFLDTLSLYEDKALMLLITKPIIETSKMFYAEAMEINKSVRIVETNKKKSLANLAVIISDISKNLNKDKLALIGDPDVNGSVGFSFVSRYNFKFGVNSITYSNPDTNETFEITPDGGNFGMITTLSKDLFGIDFENDAKHKELRSVLRNTADKGKEYPAFYIRAIYDALTNVIRPRIELLSMSASEKSKLNNLYQGFQSTVLDKMNKEGNIDYRNLENTVIPFVTSAAVELHRTIEESENKYTGNRLKSTTMTLEGTTVAGFSLYSYGFGVKQHLERVRRDIKDSIGRADTSDSVLFGNVLVQDPDFLKDVYVRSAIKIGAKVKSNTAQTHIETLNYNINLAYFGRISSALAEQTEINPIFDITVYSDKGTNLLPSVGPTLNGVNIFVDSNNKAVSELVTKDALFKSNQHYYTAYVRNILHTWEKVFTAINPGTGKFFRDMMSDAMRTGGLKFTLETLNAFNSDYWKKSFDIDGVQLTGYAAARYYAHKGGTHLTNWIHYQSNAKTLKPDVQLVTSSELVQYVELYDKRSAFDSYMNKRMVEFANDLIRAGFEFDKTSKELIKNLYGIPSDITHPLSGFVAGDIMTITKGDRIITEVNDINPAIRKFFFDTNLVSENFMNASAGTPFAHKGTGMNKKWVTQVKRNVTFTAAMRKYSLGLETGVEDYTSTAFVDDFETKLKTILGDEYPVVDLDGASYETMTQRIKTWNSLNYKFDGDGGLHHKSFISDFDTQTGEFGETKHAAFAMTFDMIRKSQGSDVDLMELHKDMYRGDISKVDITKTWKGDSIDLANPKNVYYWRRNYNYDLNLAGNIYKLEYIKATGERDADNNVLYEVGTRDLAMSPNEVSKNIVPIKTFYDLWTILGDIDSVQITKTKTEIATDGDKGNKTYFKASIDSAEHLVNYESYIGRGDYIYPTQYIEYDDTSKKGYDEYMRMFNTDGILSSVIKLYEKHKNATEQDQIEFGDVQIEIQDAFDHLNVREGITAKDFLASITDKKNQKGFNALFKKLESKGKPVVNAKRKVYQKYKGSNIDRITMAGGQKVGQKNLNDSGTISKSRRNLVVNATLESHTNHSGGANGADTDWDMIGSEFGMVNNKHYYLGDKTPRGNVDITGTDEAKVGPTMVAKAAKAMWGYTFPTMKDKLLIRNWAQVKNSDAVFAIATIGQQGDVWKLDLAKEEGKQRILAKEAVQGGTGYAVEMAIQAGKPVYVFDQDKNSWFTWKTNADLFGDASNGGAFVPIETPKLTPNFAGIGSREINDVGREAIKNAYQRTLESIKEEKSNSKIAGINQLITGKVSNLHAGVQLNAYHETEAAKVTAPSQMINAFVFNGKSIEQVKEIYEALGNIVNKRLTIYLSGDSGGSLINIPQVVDGLSLKDYYAVNKEKIALIFKQILDNKIRNQQDFTIEGLIIQTFNHNSIPIDDPNIFNSAIAEMTNYFTKTGIRIDFDGMFATLTPSSGSMQVHDVKGGYLPIKVAGGLVYRKLPANKVTILTNDDYKAWKALSEFHAKSPQKLESNGGENGDSDITNGTARDLKGQQVVIEFENGDIQELSVLRQGQQSQISEAKALEHVKTLISVYDKDISNLKKEGNLTIDAILGVENKFNAALKSALKADPKGTDLKSNPHMRYAFSIFESLQKAAGLKLQKGDLLNNLYQKYNNNANYQDRKIQRLEGEKKLIARLYQSQDKVNTIGKVFLSTLHRFLDDLSLYNEGQASLPESLTDATLTDPTIVERLSKERGAKIHVSRAEVIAPITARNSFMLREGDDLNDIDEEFFLRRLNESLSIYDATGHSIIISGHGKKLYVSAGVKPDDIDTYDRTITDNDGSVWYTNESKEKLFLLPEGVTIGRNGDEVRVYLNENAKNELAIQEKLQALVTALNKKYQNEGDSFEFKSLANPEVLKQNARLENEKKAVAMHVSWMKYLNLIGTRIPGQHYQSFQGLKIVGFTEGNQIYVPNEVTLLSGSDFDIDKQNIIYRSIDGNGTIAKWHPAFDYSSIEALDLSMKLPIPKGRKVIDFTQPLNEDSMLLEYPDTRTPDVATLVKIYNDVKLGHYLSKDTNPLILQTLEEMDDVKTITINGIQNFTIEMMDQTIEKPSNFIYLSRPVAMDVPATFASDSPKGEASARAVRENPASISTQKNANMIGKQVIGIMAVALKAFSALSYTYNNEFIELGKLLKELDKLNAVLESGIGSRMQNEDNIKEVARRIDEILLATNLTTYIRKDKSETLLKYHGFIMDMLVNINIELMSPEALEMYFRNLVQNNSDLELILENGNKDQLKAYMILRGGFQDDAADILSQLLSAATDNAKELILDKINASPDLAGIYSTMIMLGVPFEQISDFMTTSSMETMIRNGASNVFQPVTAKNSIKGMVGLIKRYDEIKLSKFEIGPKEALGIKINNDLQEKYKIKIISGVLEPTLIKNLITGEVHNYDQFEQMSVYISMADEISLLGRYLGINQGVKSNNWDLYNFTTGIENYMSKTVPGFDFTFKKFLDSLANNDDYHKLAIKKLSERKTVINILYVLSTNPHFAKQLTAYNSANTILKLNSYRVNSAYSITDKLKSLGFLGKSSSLSKDQFREVEKFIDNTVVETFIHSETADYKKKKFTDLETLKTRPVFYDSKGERIELTTIEGRTRFAEWARTEFLDKIKKLLPTNRFVGDLKIDYKLDKLSNDKFEFMRLAMDSTNVKDLIQSAFHGAYSTGLKKIYKSKMTDGISSDPLMSNNIFNVLYWYNLVVNKNSISKTSYGKLLAEVAGLGQEADNPYRRFLDFTGFIGKQFEDVAIITPGDRGTMLMRSNGIEFDLENLFVNYEVGDVTYVGVSRGFGLEDFFEAEQEQDDYWDDSDYSGGDGSEGEIDYEQLEELDENQDDQEYDENAPAPLQPKLTVEKTRDIGQNNGTKVTITVKLGATVQPILKDHQVEYSSIIIPHHSTKSRKFTTFGKYMDAMVTPIIESRDAINYIKMANLTMKSLLNLMIGNVGVEISYMKDGQQIISEIYDPNKDYEC